jgi:hypothetical protein
MRHDRATRYGRRVVRPKGATLRAAPAKIQSRGRHCNIRHGCASVKKTAAIFRPVNRDNRYRRPARVARQRLFETRRKRRFCQSFPVQS